MTQKEMKKISEEKYIDLSILQQINKESKNDAEFWETVNRIIEIGNPVSRKRRS